VCFVEIGYRKHVLFFTIFLWLLLLRVSSLRIIALSTVAGGCITLWIVTICCVALCASICSTAAGRVHIFLFKHRFMGIAECNTKL
jgi:hypothetical protein